MSPKPSWATPSIPFGDGLSKSDAIRKDAHTPGIEIEFEETDQPKLLHRLPYTQSKKCLSGGFTYSSGDAVHLTAMQGRWWQRHTANDLTLTRRQFQSLPWILLFWTVPTTTPQAEPNWQSSTAKAARLDRCVQFPCLRKAQARPNT